MKEVPLSDNSFRPFFAALTPKTRITQFDFPGANIAIANIETLEFAMLERGRERYVVLEGEFEFRVGGQAPRPMVRGDSVDVSAGFWRGGKSLGARPAKVLLIFFS